MTQHSASAFPTAAGRYLSPEPLLQDPIRVLEAAREGRSTATYAYALNNPIGTIDADGLWPWEHPKCRQLAYYRSEGGALGMGGACTCRVRTIDASSATLGSTGTQRCWSLSLMKAADDAEHPDGHDGKGCWQDPATSCDDVCRDEAMRQWASVKAGGNAWGGTEESCLNPMTWGMKLLDKDMCSP